MPGSTQSAREASSFTQWRIVSVDDHSVGRRLVSNEMVRPAARITSIDLSAACRLVSEMAANTPVACRWRAERSQASSTSAGPMWLAAEPLRWYSIGGSLPSVTRPLNWKPVRCVASVITCEQSMPSARIAASSARPMESVPRRLAQPTFRPRRDRPMATLVSAPAVRLWKVCAPSSGPASLATSISIASPRVTTSRSVLMRKSPPNAAVRYDCA
ncbi:hypothetical protein D3C72_1137640 [compost metagenome]